MNKRTVFLSCVIIEAVISGLICGGCGKSKEDRDFDEAIKKQTVAINQFDVQAARDKQEAAQLDLKIKKEEADRNTREALEEKAEIDRNKAEDMARRKKDQDEAISKRKEITKYVAEKFSKVSFSPTISLSGRAKSFGIEAYCTGQDLDKYRQLLKEKKYFDLCRTYGEFNEEEVNESFIDSCYGDITRHDFFLVITAKTKIADNLINVVKLGSIDDPENFADNDNYDGEQHPDGKGVLKKWDSRVKEILVLVSTDRHGEGSAHDECNKIENQFANQRRALSQKLELGELSETAFHAQMKLTYQNQRAEYIKLIDRF